MSYGFKMIIEGDFACFTRPEMKVERVSYDVPTPSAVEGMLKSIYWKPAIKYVIDKIVVFNPINFINIRRNEVKDTVSYQSVKSCLKNNYKDLSIYATYCRSQRAAMILKNVKYGVEFHFELTGIQSDKTDECEEKHYNIIKRRIEKGQCFRTLCLGCSEFPVKRFYITDAFDYSQVCKENVSLGDVDLGFMLYSLKFADDGKPINNDWDNPVFSDCANAIYYRPHMVKGIIDVELYRRNMKC